MSRCAQGFGVAQITSSKRDISARLRRRPNDFLAAPPASPTAPQAPLTQRLTPLRHAALIRRIY